ncbi:hypothetical protein C8F04DRAFT_1183239 [Mycena alexandri]|uniref:F-box domain-containing protein n=1 Tax=Mycena alexandri TaxID=1745969 RepID=A0AAD6SVA7_9AGAR|nr:hypothetical protein C8F04DRAFT_1183239 [Mycena alexandri]
MPDVFAEKLPLELVSYIFEFVLYGWYTDYWSFALSRLQLMRTSPFFLYLILHSPELWSLVMVSPRLPVQATETILGRSGSLPLDLLMHFHESHFKSKSGLRNLATYGVESIVTTRLQAVIQHLHRWKSLRVEADHTPSFLHLRRLLCAVAPPDLRRFTFVVLASSPLSPTNWLQGRLDHVEELSIFSTSMMWSALPPLLCLRRLRIDTTSPEHHPTFAVMRRLIETSPLLQYLGLRYTGCDMSGVDAATATITSSSITHLNVNFAAFLAPRTTPFHALRCPNLIHVTLAVHKERDVADAVACAHVFRSASSLKLSTVALSRDTSLDMVYDIFDRLTSLDLLNCEPDIVLRLIRSSEARMSGGVTYFLPHLETVTFDCVELPLIRRFGILHGVSIEGASVALRHVRATIYPSKVDADADGERIIYWLAAQLVKFDNMYQPVDPVVVRTYLKNVQWNKFGLPFGKYAPFSY